MEKFRILSAALVLISAISIVSQAHAAEKNPESWSVYYGYDLPAEDFLPYDLVVFDSVKHPPLRPLQNRGKTLLGYLSIGEAENYRQDFTTIKNLGVLLQENKNWPGHYVIDIRNPRWVKYLIEEKIPEILFQRFDGIMLDTLDSPLYLEELDPVRYKGMRKAAVNLIRELRMQYPNIKIMVNRGFEVLPELAPQIDMVMGESMLADAYPEKQKPKFIPQEMYDEYVRILNKAREASPNLKIYSLDYWLPQESEPIKKIYNTQRQNGFIPYVSTPDLQKILPEPR